MSPFSCAHLILFFGADVLLSKNAFRSIRDQVREDEEAGCLAPPETVAVLCADLKDLTVVPCPAASFFSEMGSSRWSVQLRTLQAAAVPPQVLPVDTLTASPALYWPTGAPGSTRWCFRLIILDTSIEMNESIRHVQAHRVLTLRPAKRYLLSTSELSQARQTAGSSSNMHMLCFVQSR
jgi:hypothetical protein